ncbi:type II toxin-antitoxin system antitoxin SocA domain-containing protein [Pseudomonas fulva]|uniref:type II toxin-antitoxin system antitoxin SocA domain-containing protein n=1 Tax=Pseudomonas fulva TaxID=47880 RepID=UPI00191CEFE4|nr:SocA family protein [Pseudomonas fulva]
MDNVKDIVAYICCKYPYSDELSNARLTKLVYLADWMSAVANDEQITDIRWLFNHYGPYVDDVIQSVKNRSDFSVEYTENNFGSTKQLVKYTGDPDNIRVSRKARNVLDAVIDKTKTMYFNDFIDYVYSTFPVSSNERYSSLDLVALASKYRRLKGM